MLLSCHLCAVQLHHFLVALRLEQYIVRLASAGGGPHSAHGQGEVAMDRFVHNANIEHYRRLISESERDPKRDEVRHAMLLTLLDEEMAKERKPLGSRS
jgi:hypothetical protein